MSSAPGSELSSLVKHAARYGPRAALKLLRNAGFDWQDIRFEGIRELDASRGELIRQIRIEASPRRIAVISLNAGLLSPGGPLPEYFKSFARSLPNPDAFIGFMGYWDSLQLSSMASAIWPELSVGGKNLLGRTYRARLRLHSPMVLHEVFRAAFPELRVQITPALFSRTNHTLRARLGGTLDGRAVVGTEFLDRHSGFRVRLEAQSPITESGIDWEHEAGCRLSSITPLLSQLRKPVEVVMRFEQYAYGQQLVGSAGGRRQLGVRPWLHLDPDATSGPGEVTLRTPWEIEENPALTASRASRHYGSPPEDSGA